MNGLDGLVEEIWFYGRGGVRLHDHKKPRNEILVSQVGPVAVGIVYDPNVLLDEANLLFEA